MRYNSQWPGADRPVDKEIHLWPRDVSHEGYYPNPDEGARPAFCGLEYNEDEHGRLPAVTCHPYSETLAEFLANERGGDLCGQCLANALYLHGLIGTGGRKAAEILCRVECGGGLRVSFPSGEEITVETPAETEITVDTRPDTSNDPPTTSN